KLQAFTALGKVASGEPYQTDMGGGFTPFRRAVEWLPAQATPIEPLLDKLAFTKGRSSWGYQFRFGLFEIGEADARMIANAMCADALPAKHRAHTTAGL
ncbi:MAG: EVE domain-containing protein, partial [Proteobacteria bacterium]|nr:EVE domain-containing protein [Pseudomonadota bacterium]